MTECEIKVPGSLLGEKNAIVGLLEDRQLFRLVTVVAQGMRFT